MDKFNLLQSQALAHINDLQETFDYIEHNVNVMKAELGKAGFRVEFDGDPFENKFIRCSIFKKNGKRAIVEQNAEVAEEDYPVELLGKYLALARATRIILGDYNG